MLDKEKIKLPSEFENFNENKKTRFFKNEGA